MNAAAFLKELFEFEYCAECGGDEAHHDAIKLDLGDYGTNWFARCKRTVTEDDDE